MSYSLNKIMQKNCKTISKNSLWSDNKSIGSVDMRFQSRHTDCTIVSRFSNCPVTTSHILLSQHIITILMKLKYEKICRPSAGISCSHLLAVAVRGKRQLLITVYVVVFLQGVSKNIPDIFDHNLNTNNQILIVFGTNIPDTTCHQMTIQFFTSLNVCFCTT